MSKAIFGLSMTAVLLAGPARAQMAPDTHAPPRAVLTAAPATSKAPTVDSLTVLGRRPPTKTCSPRDKECIALVVAELKEIYPQQLKAFCSQWKMQAVRAQWANDQLLESLGDTHQPAPPAFGVNPAVTVACARDKPAPK